MGRSAASIAKNAARSREWAKANREHLNAAKRASRAKARPELTLAQKSADGAYRNWLELENRIRAVVAKAIAAGTVERGSRWYGLTLEAYLATPLPRYVPGSHATRQGAAK